MRKNTVRMRKIYDSIKEMGNLTPLKGAKCLPYLETVD